MKERVEEAVYLQGIMQVERNSLQKRTKLLEKTVEENKVLKVETREAKKENDQLKKERKVLFEELKKTKRESSNQYAAFSVLCTTNLLNCFTHVPNWNPAQRN